jgi:hypothetical protein
VTVCGCGRDHDADRTSAVNRWTHEKLTGTTLAGDPLLDVDGNGPHYGRTYCHGPCCDPPSAEALAAHHDRVAYAIGNERAERQVAAWRQTEPARYRAEPADPTAILDEPDVSDVTSFGGVTVDDEFCADCGTVHPPLLAMIDRVYVGSYAGVPDDWEEVSIVSVGLDPAGGVVEIAVQFDDGPLVLMSPSALERLGVTVSVS